MNYFSVGESSALFKWHLSSTHAIPLAVMDTYVSFDQITAWHLRFLPDCGVTLAEQEHFTLLRIRRVMSQWEPDAMASEFGEFYSQLETALLPLA